MKTRAQKQKILEDLRERLQRARALYLLEFQKLPAEDLRLFRKTIREQEAEFVVTKNTLLARALRETETALPEDGLLRGPTGVVFAYADPLLPLQPLLQQIEESEGALNLKGALLEGLFLGPQDLPRLKKWKSKADLVAEVVGSLQGPLYALVSTLQGILSSLVWTLEEIQKKKSNGGGI